MIRDSNNSSPIKNQNSKIRRGITQGNRYKSRVSAKKSDTALATGLLMAVFLWGGTNTATRYLVGIWPPIWTGATRFLCAGLLLLGILRWTTWLGTRSALSADIARRLWWRGGLSL